MVVALPTGELRLRALPSRAFPINTSALVKQDCDLSLSGTVTTGAESTPIANVPVRLYHSPSMVPVAVAMTDDLGAFQFGDLYGDAMAYAVVCLAPRGIEYNAIIFDRLTPG